MSRALVSLLLFALAAPGAAQILGARPHAPAPAAQKPIGGIRPVVSPPRPTKAWIDPAEVAALRALHEALKAAGKLCPERAAYQAKKLAELEKALAAQQAARKRIAGIRAADR
jgi:hypothetical protein